MTFGEPFRTYYLDEALTVVTADELSLGNSLTRALMKASSSGASNQAVSLAQQEIHTGFTLTSIDDNQFIHSEFVVGRTF